MQEFWYGKFVEQNHQEDEEVDQQINLSLKTMIISYLAMFLLLLQQFRRVLDNKWLLLDHEIEKTCDGRHEEESKDPAKNKSDSFCGSLSVDMVPDYFLGFWSILYPDLCGLVRPKYID